MKYYLISLLCLVLCAGCADDDSSKNSKPEGYIEIMSVEPDTVTADEETTFTININFGVSTKHVCTVYAGFNNVEGSPSAHQVDQVLEISGPEEGSETVSITLTPVIHENWDDYTVYVNIAPENHGSSWSPVASDYFPIVVNPNTQAVNAYPERHKDFSSRPFATCDGDTCTAFDE